MPRLAIRAKDLRDLSIRSKNQCAFPGCCRVLLDENGVYVAELCHIEAAEPGGQRYNPSQSDEERRSPSNLLFLCHEHHKVTDDEQLFPPAKLRDMKLAHEALPKVVFDSDLLLQRIDDVLKEQAEIRTLLTGQPARQAGDSFEIVGPELREGWTPESGRFYESPISTGGKFKYMMRDGWLHVEQTLQDGAVAYYEVNQGGQVRHTRFPYPVSEYKVVIPEDLILNQVRSGAPWTNSEVVTLLKWSKGRVIERFNKDALVEFQAECRHRIDHQARTVTIV